LRFFLPHWDDKVHTKFDFANDKPIINAKNPELTHSFIWDLYGKNKTPIDGLLISKANLLTKNGKFNKVAKGMKKLGLRKYLRFPDTLPIMADCGAFSYVDEKEPPYDPIDTLEFYYDMKFDIGVAVDHLIIPKTLDQKEYRSEITLRNAKIMFDEWRSVKKYHQTFKLIGVIQGWDLDSYVENARKLLNMGYDYIAIGGVALSPNSELIPIIKAVAGVIKNYSELNSKKIDLHILGVGRASLFRTYIKNNVSSFDTAAYLRQAWLAEKKGYQLNFNEYMTIRIKQNHDFKEEIKTLDFLRKFSNDLTTLKKLNNVLIRNNEFTDMINRKQAYNITLESHCWKECPCKICQNVDIDVIIFRGNNRNRRRGFHNVWNFYFNKFRKFIPQIAFVYVCDEIPSAKTHEKIPKELLEILSKYPIEVFIKDENQTLHVLENDFKLKNSHYMMYLKNSNFIISNKEQDKNTLVLKSKYDLEKIISKIIQDIMQKLEEPINLKLLENIDDNQHLIDKFIKKK